MLEYYFLFKNNYFLGQRGGDPRKALFGPQTSRNMRCGFSISKIGVTGMHFYDTKTICNEKLSREKGSVDGRSKLWMIFHARKQGVDLKLSANQRPQCKT